MVQVPHDSPSTLLIEMPLTVSGELSYIFDSGMPWSRFAASPKTLNAEPVCSPEFAKSKPLPSAPP